MMLTYFAELKNEQILSFQIYITIDQKERMPTVNTNLTFTRPAVSGTQEQRLRMLQQQYGIGHSTQLISRARNLPARWKPLTGR